MLLIEFVADKAGTQGNILAEKEKRKLMFPVGIALFVLDRFRTEYTKSFVAGDIAQPRFVYRCLFNLDLIAFHLALFHICYQGVVIGSGNPGSG